MCTTKQYILSVTVVIFVITILTQTAQASNLLKVSGGEDHTLVLSENKFVWACGSNYFYQLGTGNSQDQWTLIQVLGGDMGTPHLQDVNNIAAGWTHSLALDVNGFVWAWGGNRWGQLGDNRYMYPQSPTPIQVHGLNNIGYLENIIAISAGRSGRHSLALDANNFVWGWGKNCLIL